MYVCTTVVPVSGVCANTDQCSTINAQCLDTTCTCDPDLYFFDGDANTCRESKLSKISYKSFMLIVHINHVDC